MSQTLTFNEIIFSPVTNQNSLWIRAVELAHALGYAQENSVSRIYRSNADEFTPDMTQVVEIFDGADSALPTKTRIFSLRGCHLLAMFARTPVAKQFRRWVLDVIEQYGDRVPVAVPVAVNDTFSLSRRTDPERKALTAIINTWVGMAPIHYAAARAQVNAHFGVASVDAMTVAQVKEAIQYVQGKIDALSAAPAALPPASGTAEVEAQLATIRAHVREIMDCERSMYFALRDTLPPLRGVTHPLTLRLHESMDSGFAVLDVALKQVENTARLVLEHARG